MCEVQFSKVDDVFEALCRTLSLNGEVNVISKKFSALNSNAERVFFADDLLKKYSLYPKLVEEKKNNDISTRYRKEGNEEYGKKNNFEAWCLYTKSIAYAENKTECLALGYANRSAVLFEKKYYKQCLEDITNAFDNNYPKNLYEKLLQREEKARELLSQQHAENYYEKVQEIKDSNKKIQCAAASVEIRSSESLGRHVVALKQISLGDVIAVEKPYAKILLKKYLQDHCCSCLVLCYNLIPCENCVSTMYCSKKCQQLAWNQFHKYECPIMPTIYRLETSKLILLPLRIAILAREHYKNIYNYKLDNPVYRSQCYEEIHFLEGNTHLRSTADLFPRAVTAAVMANFIKTKTSFYRDLKNCKKAEEIFNELIMRHLQTAPTNFHEISECIEDDEAHYNSEEIGAGAYAFLSLLNHSCTPNVIRHCHGDEIILRAIKPIPKGGELLDNYGYHHAVMNKTDRQRELKRQYFFECNCEACENNWPLYNNMSYKGKSFKIPHSSITTLRKGSRSEAVVMLTVLLAKYEKVKVTGPDKAFADLQETMKQCYALLGNKKNTF